MIATPLDFYNYLKKKYNASDVILCDLHKPCTNTRLCDQPQENTPVIDFDKVMIAYFQGQSRDQSTDGFTVKDDKLIFVEIKGWSKFIQFQYPRFNDDDKISKIEDQNNKFDFKNKIIGSLNLCYNEIANKDFFDGREIDYIIITDITVQENPLLNFQSNLQLLSSTAFNVEKYCSECLRKKIESPDIAEGFDSVKQDKHINIVSNVFYKSCKDFDNCIATL